MSRSSELPRSSKRSLAKFVLNEFKKVHPADTNVFFFCNDFYKLLIITKDSLIYS